jgi:hypothetical protein
MLQTDLCCKPTYAANHVAPANRLGNGARINSGATADDATAMAKP